MSITIDRQTGKYLRYTLGIALTAIIAWYFREVIVYILLAAIISLMGKPIVGFLHKWRIKKVRLPLFLCALLALVIVVGFLVGVFFIFAPLVTRIVQTLKTIDLPSLGANLQRPLASLNLFLHKYFPGYGKDITMEVIFNDYILPMLDFSQVENILTSVAGTVLGTVVGTAAKLLVAVFVVVFIAFFFLKDAGVFHRIILSFVPSHRERQTSQALDRTEKLLGHYFIGIFIETLIITLCNALGLSLVCKIDFQFALALAFFAGVINVIPYVGPLCGGAFGMLFGLLTYSQTPFNGPLLRFLLLIAVVYLCTHLIDIIFLQPWIYANSVQSKPLAVFVVILLGGTVGGIAGMWVAIPCFTVVLAFMQEFFPDTKFVKLLKK